MPPKKTQSQPTPDPETPENLEILDQLRASYAEEDELAVKIPFDKEAFEAAKARSLEILMRAQFEEVDQMENPGLFAIREQAQSRKPMAGRLMVQPRMRCKLPQRIPPEKPLPPEDAQLNGIHIPLPRGIAMDLPVQVGRMLESIGLI